MRFTTFKLIARQFLKSAAIYLLDIAAVAINAFHRLNQWDPSTIYICLLKPLGIGDIIMLSSFVQNLADMFPESQIYLMTEYDPFIGFSGIEWVHPNAIDKQQLSSSLAISPTLSWRHIKYAFGAGNYLGYFLSARLMCSFEKTNFKYDGHKRHYIERTLPLIKLLKGAGVQPVKRQGTPVPLVDKYDQLPINQNYICIAPYSNWPERQYPEQAYVQLINYYSDKLPVILLGGNQPAECEFVEKMLKKCTKGIVLNFVGRTSLKEAAYIIKNATVFIGNDSGLAHLSMLCRTPSVIIFGCVGGDLRIPVGSANPGSIRALGAGEGCRFFPCYRGFSKPVCRNRNRFCCLKDVNIETVIVNINSLIENVS